MNSKNSTLVQVAADDGQQIAVGAPLEAHQIQHIKRHGSHGAQHAVHCHQLVPLAAAHKLGAQGAQAAHEHINIDQQTILRHIRQKLGDRPAQHQYAKASQNGEQAVGEHLLFAVALVQTKADDGVGHSHGHKGDEQVCVLAQNLGQTQIRDLRHGVGQKRLYDQGEQLGRKAGDCKDQGISGKFGIFIAGLFFVSKGTSLRFYDRLFFQQFPPGFPVRQQLFHLCPEGRAVVQLQKVAVLVYYHIDLRCRGLIIQLQSKGDLPLARAAHAPAAGHAAHFQDRLLPAQHPGKGRVDLIAHGGKVGQCRGLVRQVSVILVPLGDVLHPGIPDPLGVLQHKTVSLLKAEPNGAPYGVQIFGEVPEIMGEATAAIEQYEFDFVDINMGCPAPKIVSGGAGSKLMLDPDRCGRIVEQVVAHTKRPVTVKMRKGWDADHITAVECAKACEQAGAALVAVHARTREQMYTPGIDPEIIARVKDAVKVPVLGNGDIHCAEDALRMVRETNCDGVMIARSALGDPWLFERVNAALEGLPAPKEPNLQARMNALRRQVEEMVEQKGEFVAMPQARAQTMHYMKGLKGAAALRRYCCTLTHLEDLDELIAAVFEEQRKAGLDPDDVREVPFP